MTMLDFAINIQTHKYYQATKLLVLSILGYFNGTTKIHIKIQHSLLLIEIINRSMFALGRIQTTLTQKLMSLSYVACKCGPNYHCNK